MADSTEATIKNFLYRFVPNLVLQNDDEDIFASGFVNSLFAIQLVMFVEKEFQIELEDEDLELDNFRTVRAVAQLVTRKQAHERASSV
ncbi:MAG: acyl carrier protein [Chloroflexi bacterium]|nr:acyl carrier protein [Chloroflexota bacterium]